MKSSHKNIETKFYKIMAQSQYYMIYNWGYKDKKVFVNSEGVALVLQGYSRLERMCNHDIWAAFEENTF